MMSHSNSKKGAEGEKKVVYKDVEFGKKKRSGGYGSIRFGKVGDISVVVKKCKIRSESEHLDSETETRIWDSLSSSDAVPPCPKLLGYGKLNKKSEYRYTKYFICEDNRGSDIDDYIERGNFWEIIKKKGGKDTGVRSRYPVWVVEDQTMYEYTMSRKEKIEICKGMGNCLYKMQKEGFVHRDIKGGNFIISKDEKGKVRLIDFGLSEDVEKAKEENSVVGTPGYCDPLVEDDGWISKKSDHYSLGVVFLRVWTGFLGPEFDSYDNPDDLEINRKARKNLRNEFLDQLKNLERKEPIVAELIRFMLSKEISSRIDMKDILNILKRL